MTENELIETIRYLTNKVSKDLHNLKILREELRKIQESKRKVKRK